MFELSLPWLLLLLPLPLLVRKLMPPVKQRIRVALRIPFFQGIEPIAVSQSVSGNKQGIALWTIWVLLIFAASGPQWIGQPMPIKRSGRNIMLALDLSGSMQIKDMEYKGQPASRDFVVKKTAENFVKRRIGDRVGLILFGTKAYLQTPLTFDRVTVEKMIADATVGLAGQTTSLGDAIGLALKRLDKASKKSRILILLTDGQNNSGVLSPIQAADIAKTHGVKIYTIGLGAEKMLVQGFMGLTATNPSSDLDVRTLKEISSLTGGQFFRAKDTKQLEKVYKIIDKLEPVKKDSSVYRPVTDYYYWPLGLALLFIFILGFYQPINVKLRQGIKEVFYG